MSRIRNTVLAVGAGVIALTTTLAHGAAVGATVQFNFAARGHVDSATAAGNTWTFSDSHKSFTVAAQGYSGGFDGNGFAAATLVKAGKDYSDYVYTGHGHSGQGHEGTAGLTGLGVCSAGDSRGDLGRCLGRINQFAVDARSASEWVLLTLPAGLGFSSVEIAPTGRRKGDVAIYSGVPGPSGLMFAGFTEVTTFSYGKNSGPQLVSLDAVAGGSLLIAADSRRTRFTVTGLYAEVVPIPAAVYLFLSGLGALFGLRRRQFRNVT